MLQEAKKLKLTNELRQLLHSIGNLRPIKKGTYLFSEGDVATELYIINSGLVKVGKFSNKGRELSFRICQKDDIVGEFSLYAEPLKYLLHAKVIESGEVLAIKHDILEEELYKNSHLAFELMQWMNTIMRRDQMRLYDLVAHGKKGALYSIIIRLTNSYGEIRSDGILINISLTNQELANFCGTARESVNRHLNELKRNEIISYKNGRMIVHDLEYLRREINCDQCPVIICSIH